MARAIIALAIAATAHLQAQDITGYRYWFDEDIASAITTNVAPTSELELSASFSTNALTRGYHTLSFQTVDSDGKWSVPHTRIFTRSGFAITGYRYWMNENTAAFTTGTVAPDQEVTLNSVIDPGTLTKDYNTVTIQFVDALGEYSVPQTVLFVKNTGEVNGYEYWIDDEIADSYTGSIGPNTVVDLVADLPTGVPAGSHTFTIRFSGANGTWSIPLTTAFESFVGIEELPGVTDLVLFPNPITEQLGLRLNADAARTLNLQVLDVSGAVVQDLSTWSVSGSAYRNWDISALASGSYLLRITDEDRIWSTRFVKQ
ncbi:MAG: T9SS type A sorting domain-containing protein [Flavobacteriales bacterium]|jgi:hypothetical protein|nr:T9SS type A sorting domain-containing protein [Flavobacteriales bacterium]